MTDKKRPADHEDDQLPPEGHSRETSAQSTETEPPTCDEIEWTDDDEAAFLAAEAEAEAERKARWESRRARFGPPSAR